jgi:Fur family ferric uptake transcriptional regulator
MCERLPFLGLFAARRDPRNRGEEYHASEVRVENQDIRKAGLKVTLPRVKILEILESSESRHMTAEDVYRALLERGEEIGLATVYRVLTQFVNAGLAERHHFEGGQAVFELDRGHHHDHIVCEQCGRVEEFLDETIEKAQQDIAAKKGFSIVDHALIIYGRCRRQNCPYDDAG